MTSVLLPTHQWTASCAALVSQLGADDELLVLCDHVDDPVVSRAPQDLAGPRVKVVPVGDPDGCSGKAHALSVGLKYAHDELIVLTDDDVERDSDWLATLTGLTRQHGAASATPVFVGDGVAWGLIEPVMLALGSALLCRHGGAWGGGVAFQRDQLDVDRFRHDLERTVSDDALLWNRLESVHTTPTFVNRVTIPRGVRRAQARITRFVLTYRYWLPRATAALGVLAGGLYALTVVAPFVAFLIVTGLTFVAYRYLGIYRRSWLLAFPAALIFPWLVLMAMVWPRFDWGGRRYRWRGRFNVTVERE